MKKIILLLGCILIMVSCQDDNEVFEQSADERVAEAISNLKQLLIAPNEGWKLRYRPESESGSYYVLLNFDEDNNVRIRTDFGASDGDFYDQTITYRIDSSLGLELILENYSFFSYLFELEGASFPAEFEFDYVNETPDGALVFRSKSDLSSPTTLVFEQAVTSDANLLGIDVDTYLSTIADDLDLITPLYKLSHPAQELDVYFTFNDVYRTISFNYASPIGTTAQIQYLNFETSYIIEGNAMILDEALEVNVYGKNLSIPSIRLNAIADASLSLCTEPFETHAIQGTLNASNISIESVILDPGGADFANIENNIFITEPRFVYNNDLSVGQDMMSEIPGLQLLVLYYEANPSSGDPFLALGYYMVNEADNTNTIAVKEFTPTYADNRITFDFAEDYTVFRDTTQTLNYEAMDKYLEALTEGDNTYIIRAPESYGYDYEFYNPCNGWTTVWFEN